jgi:hypothetical protein
MAKYISTVDRWISHESRTVKAGEEFETEFPTAGGKPMRLGDTLREVASSPATKKGHKPEVESLT